MRSTTKSDVLRVIIGPHILEEVEYVPLSG